MIAYRLVFVNYRLSFGVWRSLGVTLHTKYMQHLLGLFEVKEHQTPNAKQ